MPSLLPLLCRLHLDLFRNLLDKLAFGVLGLLWRLLLLALVFGLLLLLSRLLLGVHLGLVVHHRPAPSLRHILCDPVPVQADKNSKPAVVHLGG